MQLFDIFAEASYNAECEIALQQLLDLAGETTGSFAEDETNLDKVSHERREAFKRGQAMLHTRGEPRSDGAISNTHLFASLRKVLPEDTIYMSDVVTNQVPFTEHLQLTVPGTHISKGGSGLGWAGGAAIGAKLALDRWDVANRPHCRPRDAAAAAEATIKLVCCVTGDGSFVFGAPSAVYWAQHKLNTPFLSIIVNNGGWKATRSCINDVHPRGLAAGVTDDGLGIDLKQDGPDYIGIAVAASNGNLHAEKVSKAGDLEPALERALKVVQIEKRGAMLEVVIATS